jgi:multiple RNA-binding domain-containing protein 1
LGPLKDDKEFKEFVTANKAIKSVENIWKNDVDFNGEEINLSNKKNEEENEKKPVEEIIEKKSNGDEDADFENGRLFVRNLAYSCKEEDLEKLFSKYKPLVECNMPIDSFSKQPKGFAYIGFMFPEHAIKAFNELDGTIFQGRMLHILPAKSKAEEEIDETKTLKQVKEDEKKKNSQKSYNWNALFINQDALANLMSDKYNVNKSDLFDVNGKTSIAVRLAVGETQIVNDIRKFLTRNGVKLDSFNNITERSKTIILVKNLPFKTKENELRTLFEKYGEIKRIVLPDYGIAALIEFKERQDARQGFIKLAYRKFKNVPLYLEWAPVDVFDENFIKELEKEEEEKKKVLENEEKKKEEEEEEDDSLPGIK